MRHNVAPKRKKSHGASTQTEEIRGRALQANRIFWSYYNQKNGKQNNFIGFSNFNLNESMIKCIGLLLVGYWGTASFS
jgi:hypothetical protein